MTKSIPLMTRESQPKLHLQISLFATLLELVLLRQRWELLTGRQTIDGVQLYFDKDGKQAKGTLVDIDGDTYYFDKDSGALWTNRTIELGGVTYNIDEEGHVTSSLRNTFVQDKDGDWTYLKDKGQLATGWQTINGVQLYFRWQW